jgi:hypothetical protein
MKTYGGVEVQIHYFWPGHWLEVCGQLHAPAALPPGKEPPVPIGQEAGCAPEPVWTLWRREKSCTAGNRTRAVQPVAIPTELTRRLSSLNNRQEMRWVWIQLIVCRELVMPINTGCSLCREQEPQWDLFVGSSAPRRVYERNRSSVCLRHKAATSRAGLRPISSRADMIKDWLRLCIFSLYSSFKKYSRLMRSRCCLYISPIVARQRLAKNPLVLPYYLFNVRCHYTKTDLLMSSHASDRKKRCICLFVVYVNDTVSNWNNVH